MTNEYARHLPAVLEPDVAILKPQKLSFGRAQIAQPSGLLTASEAVGLLAVRHIHSEHEREPETRSGDGPSCPEVVIDVYVHQARTQTRRDGILLSTIINLPECYLIEYP